MNKKQYIGDSVYADTDGFGIILTTENGLPTDPSNKIYLEPKIFSALTEYVKWLSKKEDKPKN